MITKPVFEYLAFGWNYKLFCDGIRAPNDSVIRTIDKFSRILSDLQMEVTLKVIESPLSEMKSRLQQLPPKERITEENSEVLKKIMEKAETVIHAECKLRQAYSITEKRFRLESLLTDIGSLFSSDVYVELPEVAKFDFAEAGKCIAFERPTAAAFHILRGTEAALRNYYFMVVKKKKLKNPMWGPMIEQLIQRKNTPKPLLDVLDNIRVNFRNPTLHPETTYVLDEAQDLLVICIDAVNRITKEVRRIKGQTATKPTTP